MSHGCRYVAAILRAEPGASASKRAADSGVRAFQVGTRSGREEKVWLGRGTSSLDSMWTVDIRCLLGTVAIANPARSCSGEGGSLPRRRCSPERSSPGRDKGKKLKTYDRTKLGSVSKAAHKRTEVRLRHGPGCQAARLPGCIHCPALAQMTIVSDDPGSDTSEHEPVMPGS